MNFPKEPVVLVKRSPHPYVLTDTETATDLGRDCDWTSAWPVVRLRVAATDTPGSRCVACDRKMLPPGGCCCGNICGIGAGAVAGVTASRAEAPSAGSGCEVTVVSCRCGGTLAVDGSELRGQSWWKKQQCSNVKSACIYNFFVFENGN